MGTSGLSVSAVGLGCMGFSQSYPPFPSKKEAIETIHRAYEMGENFFDMCGLGVKSIRYIVEKYYGNELMQKNGERFQVDIMFYICCLVSI
ncbi:aldo/keto reductase [Blautia producta]